MICMPGDNATTLLNVNVNCMSATIPAENKLAMIEAEITNLNLLKGVCENDPE